ncbi:MAG TPA: class I SAM-dependent methyltransferase [Ktedonobacterales bacterium]|nr:class I SAM-dependent methyltransferase [Ktedonobacterales bacterium]
MEQSELFAQMQLRYREGVIPWNQPLPPPEVIALAEQLAPGRALDMGCGAGRTCVYLAQRGWTCDGVDFVPEAIEMAQTRAQAEGVADRTRFVVASVTHIPTLSEPYDLVVDIGCMHNLRGDDLRLYAAEVTRMLRPDGVYLLFAHLADDALADALPGETEPDMSHQLSQRYGLSAQAILSVLTPHFALDRLERGQTTVGESTWPSAWFWLRRLAR